MTDVEKLSSVLVGDGDDDDRTQCLRKWGRLTGRDGWRLPAEPVCDLPMRRLIVDLARRNHDAVELCPEVSPARHERTPTVLVVGPAEEGGARSGFGRSLANRPSR